MARLSLQLQKAVEADHVKPFTVIEAGFPDGTARFTSLPYDVKIGAHTYSGVSVLAGLSEITEGPENRSYGVNITLAGAPLEFAEYLVKQDVKGQLVQIFVGFINENNEIVAELYPVFAGLGDTMDLRVGQDIAVNIAVESLLVQWERARTRRYTDVDQQARYPGDRGLEYVAAMTAKDLKWGRTY